ncbi:ubiquitin carboxyl-terminal hydrolase MINDY-1 isoform X2 [Rhinichthys klamathensis goyatoka]|uniref:ubiquitin carboxyl-terminal hydrolase MINDY-1 isoform X2 n=1 Tax=Rhinichthys klamathensis goyatoka TaxID=3034132 RepID=UPI0024B61C6B|nr:ubiquitin carboxyl-terminal hydrolase MINDY-1 isoform X2 [Rhinichthys klamathensis goyatoka]
MADSCPDTVDGEIIGLSEGQQLNTSKNEDFDPGRPQDKKISQKEGVTTLEQSSGSMKDDLTPCKGPPTTTTSPENDANAAQSTSVTSKNQDKTDESELINSQSCTPSQSEVTPTFSVASLEFSEETNGIPPDGPLISPKSAQDGNQVPSQGNEGVGAGPARASEPGMPAYYFVKWITWKEKKTAIITQSENGPCPLIAIMNILLLRWKVKFPAQTEVVTTEELMAHLGECVLSIKPREKAEGMELNFQQNMSDAMAVLPKLSTGLDVNVRFTGVSDFEYTPECIVFDLLDIPLYHGWLVDPQSPEVVSAVGKLSYNQLVEKIIDFKHSTDSSQVSEGLIAEQFLESTATQLSYHGLCELNTTAKEGELSVFFRNNHFSTMIKHKGHLYLLVTDQGFLQEESVVWESLHNVEGDGNFCDSDFRLCHPSQKPTAASQPSVQQQQMQIDQDYLVAMSLQQEQGEAPGPLSDLELARQLQQEEYQQPQTQQQPPTAGQMRGQAASQQGGQRRREKKEDSDCCIL